MKHEGALSIHSNGELLLELAADGTVTAGPRFNTDENTKLVFRALALKYPRWAGDMIAAYVRSLPATVSSRVAVASAAGGPVAGDLATRIYRAVLEEVALRAEENGQEAEAREAERQREQFRAEANQNVTLAEHEERKRLDLSQAIEQAHAIVEGETPKTNGEGTPAINVRGVPEGGDGPWGH